MNGTLVNETTTTQCGQVLQYLQDNGSISQIEAAVELGVWRLSARVWDLRHAGHVIRQEMVTKKNRYGRPVSFARYTLEADE